MSFTTCSTGALAGLDFCLIFAPLKGYDEPEILPYSIRQICLIGADAGHRTNELLELSTQQLKRLGNDVASLSMFKNVILQSITDNERKNHPNPLNRCGMKCFSQSDEDGITLEIVQRLGLRNGVYGEFGVGNGMENNTLILATAGWRGFWVGGQDLAFNYRPTSRHLFTKDWITLENITNHARAGSEHFGTTCPDLISLDLDGNDYYFVAELLRDGYQPKVFVIEYNSKFPPPIEFVIPYNAQHVWQKDDFYGASLSIFARLFEAYGYTLVCCNAHTGANAYFVKNEFLSKFADVPDDIRVLFMPPRYHLFSAYGHKPSPKVVETIFYEDVPPPLQFKTNPADR